MARVIGGASKKKSPKQMPETKKMGLGQMAMEYVKMAVTKKKRTAKTTGLANAANRGNKSPKAKAAIARNQTRRSSSGLSMSTDFPGSTIVGSKAPATKKITRRPR